jgi:hypothetical protein
VSLLEVLAGEHLVSYLILTLRAFSYLASSEMLKSEETTIYGGNRNGSFSNADEYGSFMSFF